MALSLTQAAKEAKISKSTLSIAVRKGRVSAAHLPDGSYEIEPAELFRVYPPKGDTTPSGKRVVPASEPMTNHTEPPKANLALLQKELEKAEALLHREREASQREREALQREQERAADLQRRLDQANEERRTAEERSHVLMLRLMPPSSERPQEISVVTSPIMQPARGFLARLLGR